MSLDLRSLIFFSAAHSIDSFFFQVLVTTPSPYPYGSGGGINVSPQVLLTVLSVKLSYLVVTANTYVEMTSGTVTSSECLVFVDKRKIKEMYVSSI